MQKLFLLDGHALIYRAHYAFIKRPMLNSKGQNVSAIMGFLTTILDLLEKEKPSHLGVAFDLPTPTFRHELYPEYKANREEQPEDISWALPKVVDILEALQIPVVTAEGYEADDVIGTLAKQAEAEGFEVYMMTPDKDYGQLVSERIYLYKPARMGNGVETLKVEDILATWQIKRVDQVVDMLGLQGDSVDNIPGIKGVGPKTAQELLAQYDTVENLLAHAHELKDRYRKLVEEGRAQALLSKELARIDTQAPVRFEASSYFWQWPDLEVALGLFRDLEFRSLSRKVQILAGQTGEAESAEPAVSGTAGETDLFGQPLPTSAKPLPKAEKPPQALAGRNIENTDHEYILLTEQDLPALLAEMQGLKAFCFDTETTGIDPMQAEIVGLALSWQAHKAYYLPLPEGREAAAAALAPFAPILADEGIAKVGQNLKYDILLLRNYGLVVKGQLWDTMLMHYALDPDGRHGMDYMAEVLLNYAPVSIESLIGKKGKNQLSMRDVELDKVKEYAAEDADITWQLYQDLLPKLQAEPELLKLYLELEAPLVQVLVEMEYNGVYVDKDFLGDYSRSLAKEIEQLQREIYQMAGLREFNLDSPRQVGEVLFEHLKIPYKGAKTKTGQYATGEDKLSELADAHPIIAKLLEYRQLSKLQSTYIEALPQLINPRTNRVHSSFNQALTTTGRLSSQNPNLQNIPIRTAKGREIRKAFVPEPGGDKCLMAADYSQIELRLIAEISGDAAMLEAFQKGQDIHAATAARIYSLPIEEVQSEHRYRAKAVNFSIIYGAGASNIAQNLGIKRQEAAALIEQYFKEYPGIKAYMERAVQEARDKGYVQTLRHRRRYLRDINSRNGMIRSHAERNAINSPIQGSAADLMKMAMIKVYETMQAAGVKARIILQVHDELVFELEREELPLLRQLVEKAMKEAMPGLQVPIEVGIDVGDNWLEAH